MSRLFTIAGATVLIFGTCAAPPLLGALLSDDGYITDYALRHQLWFLSSGLVGVGLAFLVVSALHRTAWPSRWTVLTRGLAALLIGATPLSMRMAWLESSWSVDLSAELTHEHIPTSWDQTSFSVDQLGAHLATRHLPALLRSEHIWALSDSALARRSNLIRTGHLWQVYDLTAPNWYPGMRLDISSFPAAAQFQLERQVFLLYLIAGASEESRTATADWVRSFLEAWSEDSGRFWKVNTWTWRDDPTANRAEAREWAMRFLRSCGRSTPALEIDHLQWVVRHGRMLMNPLFHTEDSNHGLMQDSALLVLGLCHPELVASNTWIATAIDRAEHYMKTHVTSEGVLKELTPEYHHHSTQKLLWFWASVQKSGRTMSHDFTDRLRLMLDFDRRILNPDASFPRIADTHGGAPITLAGWPFDELPQWSELDLLRRLRDDARRPPAEPEIALWPESGYFVARTRSGGEGAASQNFLTFMCSRASEGHIHPNQLSITLFAHGVPIIDGPGYPSYFDATYRAKRIATSNQSTMVVDGASQHIGDAPILFFESGGGADPPGYATIAAQSALYDGVFHVRTLGIGADPNGYVLIDQVFADRHHQYAVSFRLAGGILAEVDELTNRATLVDARGTPLATIRSQAQTIDGAPCPLLIRWEPPMLRMVAENVASVKVVTYVDVKVEDQETVSFDGNHVIWQGASGTLTWQLGSKSRPVRSLGFHAK